MENTEKIYGKLKISRSLPSPPQVLLKLIDACNTNKTSPKTLAGIVFKDPSISTKILQLINSSYMGLRKKVDDLEKAVIYLGADTIKNVAISASVLQVFGRAKGNETFNLNHFWWHSVMCGTLGKRIAKKVGHSPTDEAFLAGMLHDIGRLVYWVNFNKHYAAALQEAGDDSELLMAKEREIGAGHHELGAWLVRQWQMNSLMADAILYHHEPLDRIVHAFPLVKIVFFANMLSRKDALEDEASLIVGRSLFSFDDKEITGLLSDAQDEVADVANSLGIPAAPPGPLISEAPAETGEVEKKLTLTIKHLSLMNGTLQELLKADTREAILKTASRGFQILFGIQRFYFFLHDSAEHVLENHASATGVGKGITENLVLSCSNRQSLLVGCFTDGKRLDSFHPPEDRPLAIADEQILRLLGTEGMICFPMVADNESVGVVLAGVTAAQSREMAEHQELLGLFTSHIGMCLYVDGIKQAQAGIIQNERLEASTNFARKVVHEVNNPLGIIKNYLKILGLKLPEKHPAQAELSVISEEIDRVGQIVRSIKDYATPRVKAQEQVNINLLLKDILTIADKSILKPAMIRLHFKPDPAAPDIRTEKNGLKQVIINLVKNAAEAMPNGGNIHVATEFQTAADPEKEPGTGRPGTVDIQIRDDGPGIPESIQRHLFEPFHSSKKDGHSGLGLSIVRSIIKELGGTITCDTSPQAGTAFRITLPVLSEEHINSVG